MLAPQIRLCKPLMNIGAATRLLFLEQSKNAILRTDSHAAREDKRILDLATSRANLVADASLFGCGYLEEADAQTLWTSVYGKWKVAGLGWSFHYVQDWRYW